MPAKDKVMSTEDCIKVIQVILLIEQDKNDWLSGHVQFSQSYVTKTSNLACLGHLGRRNRDSNRTPQLLPQKIN